ncbi:MAG: methyltransferase [Armatimonadota bacterium]|nr:methyltransferase [Armatimonadota bacterium]MDR7519034.1 methyltransferase [Armatimonadota bacterium]
MDRTLVDRDRANRLFDAYGALLTARQQRMLRQYYQDDLSLGEIAGQMRVSRQAVHDGLRRALAALERYEAALRLVDRPDRPPRPAAQPAGARGGEHYYVPAPRSRLRCRVLKVTLRGRRWTFQTASGVFSHRALDAGTRLLAERMRVGRADRVLDMGCGYGVIGLVAAALAPQGEVWMTDTNQRAAALARANAARHHLPNVRVVVADAAGPIRDCSVDLVLTNPPIRAGRRVVRTFIDEAWRVLRPGGRFYLVARTAQGARTLARFIEERFGGIRQVAASGGYRVYEATRSQPSDRSSTEAAGV